MTLQIKRFEEPLQLWSLSFATYSQQLLINSLNQPFATFASWSKAIAEKLPWLVKIESTLRGFKESIDAIKEIKGLYLKLREAYGRTPAGYITEIRVVIPESNRQLEYQIYDAFRELLKTSGSLLFDLHTIKLRGRSLDEAIPRGFWRYE